MGDVNFPAPAGTSSGYGDLSELVGQTVTVTEVADKRGVPVLVLDDGRRFLPDDDWGEACLTHLAAHLEETGEETIAVTVAEKRGQFGLTSAD